MTVKWIVRQYQDGNCAICKSTGGYKESAAAVIYYKEGDVLSTIIGFSICMVCLGKGFSRRSRD